MDYRKILLFLLLSLLIASNSIMVHAFFEDGFESEVVDPVDPEPFPLQGMTTEHNEVRASGNIPAPDPALTPLSWDEDIAEIAQAYADRCIPAHSGNNLGENIFAFASTGPEIPDAKQVVGAWASEREFYNYNNNSCSAPTPPGTCGHYTQIVWSNATQLGCGYKACPPNNIFPINWQLWVCNYDSIQSGARPY